MMVEWSLNGLVHGIGFMDNIVVMIGRCVLAFTVLLMGTNISGQEIHGSLSGRVLNEDNGRPLGQIQVQATLNGESFGQVTDSLGQFRMDALPVGIYRVVLSSLSHGVQVHDEVWIRAGKTKELNVHMAVQAFELPSFEVGTERVRLERMGVRTFTVEQSLRYAATFSDPARLVTTYPGVAVSNDQANHFSVRGNSPNSNKWFIEGMEVVSPNHLSNAGTPTDLPTLSGGGVNMLSAQMLDYSYFRNGPMDVRFGNATGGIMDMRLRRGSDSTEWTAQAGLIGIDLANEGRITKQGGSSYLVNYRYSTLGLLSAIGVDLGDEEIRFQDLSFALNFPIGPNSELQIFGVGGLSTNEFEAPRDTSEWEVDKDSLDIDYRSEIAIVGTQFTTSLGESSKLRVGSVYSSSVQTRDQNSINGAFEESEPSEVELDKSLWTNRVGLDKQFGRNWNASVGATFIVDELRIQQGLVTSSSNGMLTRVYTTHEVQAAKGIDIGLGVGLANWDLSNTAEPEGHLRVGMEVSDRIVVELRAGRRTQRPFLENMAESIGFEPGIIRFNTYQNAPLMTSEDAELGISWRANRSLRIQASLFHQTLSGLPTFTIVDINGTPIAGYDLFNAWNEILPSSFSFDGEAELYGAELSARRSMQNGLYAFGNVSVFESNYSNGFLEEASSRWDIGYATTIGFGKEFVKQKEELIRTLGIGAVLQVNGGNQYDVLENRRGLVVNRGTDFYDAYQRLDLRIYWKKDRPNRTGMWAIDIQNALNVENGFYDYFDQRSQEVIRETQLGIIPNLSYRIEF